MSCIRNKLPITENRKTDQAAISNVIVNGN